MNRRGFFKASLSGTALSMLCLSAGRALASVQESVGRVEVGLVVWDGRMPAPENFAQEAEHLGLKKHRIDGDVSALWYQQLDPMWSTSSLVVAGITAIRPLFILEQMARDRNVRLALSVEHRPQLDGSTEHWIQAPASEIDALQLILRQESWPRLLAHYFRSGVGLSDRASVVRVRCITPAALGRSLAEVPLTSWVLAPV